MRHTTPLLTRFGTGLGEKNIGASSERLDCRHETATAAGAFQAIGERRVNPGE